MTDKTPFLKKTANILIVDDHPMVREGRRVRIESQPDLQVCGEAASADAALEQVERSSPDLILVDIRLAESSGMDLIREIQDRFPGVKMLVVSAHEEKLSPNARCGPAFTAISTSGNVRKRCSTPSVPSSGVAGF